MSMPISRSDNPRPQPFQKQGSLTHWSHSIGTSAQGVSLQLFQQQPKEPLRFLVIAGLHGEEPETVVLLSRILRMLQTLPTATGFLLCANPDGTLLGTRGNANQVDLNRNFPAKNWQPETTWARPFIHQQPAIPWSPGKNPGSEPETQAILSLCQQHPIQHILSLHSPYGWVDSPESSIVVDTLCEMLSLPWVSDPGYSTPGSLGSWCLEQNIECITLELPNQSTEQIIEFFGPGLWRFFQHFLPGFLQ